MNGVAKALVLSIAFLATERAGAQDWSQWRGVNRDGKAAEFTAPASWPKELVKKWQVPIGDGVATPSIVGDRLFVFSRQDGNEIARCLDAATSEEIWKDSYASEGTTGGASGFQGPRCSPTVADGKVVTLGVRGVLSCFDAATGKDPWRKDDFNGKWPMFYTSASPLVVDGLCIAQLGGPGDGGVVAYDLASGDERWRWTGEGPSNGSPVVMEFGDTKVVIAPTEKSLVGVRTSDGKLLWQIQYTQGRGTSATPIVGGETLYLAGPGTGMSAIALKLDGDELKEEQLWTNTDVSVQFSTPILRDEMIFGLSNNYTLFCVNAQTHATAWNTPLGGAEPPPPSFGPFGRGGGRGRDRGDRPRDGEQEREQPREGDAAQAEPRRDEAVRPAAAVDGTLAQATPSDPPAAEQGGERGGDGERRGGGRGRGGRGRGGGGRGGYGSIVDAGSVLLALTPASELVVYEPSDSEFKELARYKVADTPTYAYPVASGNRIFVKDQDNVTLWVVE